MRGSTYDARTPAALNLGLFIAFVANVATQMKQAGAPLADILPADGEAAPIVARLQAGMDHILAGQVSHQCGPETDFDRIAGGPNLVPWLLDIADAALLYGALLRRLVATEAPKMEGAWQAVWRGDAVADADGNVRRPTSLRRQLAARENGKKGGRPRRQAEVRA
jgi:hypothetical protein